MNPKERLIIALDVTDKKKCLELIDILEPAADIFKVGVVPFAGFGRDILKTLGKKKKKTFLDLKFHDIPNTVRLVARAMAEEGVFMMNFHCFGGRKMLEAARQGADEGAAAADRPAPILLGVTVLTSMDTDDLAQLGIAGTAEEKAVELALMAKGSRLDGVVASAEEAGLIKEKAGKDFIVVAPGIRPSWAVAGDQKRIMTPKRAIENGADYIVVGRPVIESDDPVRAVRKIIMEMEASCRKWN